MNLNNNKIKETLNLIQKQIGLNLVLCNYFTGIRFFNNKPYFNVVLKNSISESKDYEKLKRWSVKYKTIKIENNGLKRLSIFM